MKTVPHPPTLNLPITSIQPRKTTRKIATSSLAPLPPQQTNFATRPVTRSSMAIKSWRQANFTVSSPASRREVELLGEWLNSVLADNLETNENPLEVCTNAQHWYSVAFNELVRQVAIDCAERGRMLAVIWKRNQNLLNNLIKVQHEEREYILACHKERMQFLKTDLEFSKSRLETISSAYNDEKERWESSHERDVSKFTSLNQKIEEQIKSRQALLEEIKNLKKMLVAQGLEDDDSQTNELLLPVYSYSAPRLTARSQKLRWDMRQNRVPNSVLNEALYDINIFYDRLQCVQEKLQETTLVRDVSKVTSDQNPNASPIKGQNNGPNQNLNTNRSQKPSSNQNQRQNAQSPTSQHEKTEKNEDFFTDDFPSTRRNQIIRDLYPLSFLSLSDEARPHHRPMQWILACISYLYSNYMNQLVSLGFEEMFERDLIDIFLELFIGMYGTRETAEQTFFDFLSTIRHSLDSGGRIFLFARFIGLADPLPRHVFHFYLFALSVFTKEHSGTLFPPSESPESAICGIPMPAACSAAEKVLKRISSGRSLKFYTERANKIAADGFLRFGGKNLSELDAVLDYILTAYFEEEAKLLDTLNDQIKKVPSPVTLFSQFSQILGSLRSKPSLGQMQKYFRNALMTSKTQNGQIGPSELMQIVKDHRLLIPIVLKASDFPENQNPDDVVPFMKIELESVEELYESQIQKLVDEGNDIMVKQLRTARAKFDQALKGRSLGRTFSSIQREFYEKLHNVSKYHHI